MGGKIGQGLNRRNHVEGESRPCTKCNIEQPSGNFALIKNQYDGFYRASWCKKCTAVGVHRYRSENPEMAAGIMRRTDLKRRFGITPEEYDVMLASQGGGCAICHTIPGARRLAVDHSHITGVVRGLLCDLCNTALGKFGDSPILLQAAIDYFNG